MPATRPRAALLLAALLLAPVAPAAPAHAAPGPPPAPPPAPGTRPELPEGPWPPREILAADPAEVAAPAAAAADAPATGCPAAPYGVRHQAPGTGRTVALTFDDGPGASTPAILSILQRYGVPATFLTVGINASVRPALVRAEVATGHAVGNHTWSHPRLPTLGAAGQAAELDRPLTQQKALVAVSPCVFRPPYGEYDATTLTLARQRRMAVWNWSVDTEDWKAGTSTASSWVERIVSRATAGGSQAHPVVLLHDPPAGIPATVSALPRIIEFYRSRGYRFVDLLGGSAGRAPTPAAATTAAGLHLLAPGSAGTVVRRTLRGSTWTGWTSLGGSVVGGPAAAALSSTTTVVTAVANGAVYRRTVTDAGTGGGWASLGGTPTSRPAVAVSPTGVEAVVVRGTNGQAYLRQRVGSTWSGWQPLGGLLAPYAPGVAFSGSGVLAVAVVAGDRSLYVRTRSAAGAWSGWRRAGGSISSDVALSRTADGTRFVAAVRGGPTGYVSVSGPGGATWGGWLTIGGTLASGPAVTVRGAALEVVVVGSDTRHYRNTATDGTRVTGWTGWRALP